MPEETGIAGLSDVFIGLAAEAPVVQQRLDREFEERLRLQSLLNHIAEQAGVPSLARDIAPSQYAIQEIEFDANWTWTRTQTAETAIRVRLLNTGFQRRFASAGMAANKLRLVVRRIPLEPGQDVAVESPAQT